MRNYFSLQFIRLNRSLTDFGLPPAVGYLLVSIAFAGISTLFFLKSDQAVWIYPFFAPLFLFRLSEIERNDFLKSCFSVKSYRTIRLIENIIITIPFAVVLVVNGAILSALGTLLLSALISLLNFKQSTHITIPTPFSRHPFEFTIGFRKTFYLYFVAYFLGIMAIQADNFNLGMAALLLPFFTAMNYYTQPEPPFFTWIFVQTPTQFLRSKSWIAIRYSTLTSLPLAVALSIFFPAYSPIVLAFLLLGYLFLLLIIYAKYAAFPKPIGLPQGILIAFSLAIPPLLIGLIFLFYSQAKANLKLLLK